MLFVLFRRLVLPVSVLVLEHVSGRDAAFQLAVVPVQQHVISHSNVPYLLSPLLRHFFGTSND